MVKFSGTTASNRSGKNGKSVTGLVAALTAMMILSGCASVPDYANPVEWYSSTVDFFGDDPPPPPLPAEAVPGADAPFPELANMPEPPLLEFELETLDSVGVGLAADRANARYTDSVIRAGGETVLAEVPSLAASPPAPVPFASAVPPIVSRAAPARSPVIGRGFDVQKTFVGLFSASGSRGVAPASSSAAIPLIASGGEFVGGGGPSLKSNKAAVIYFNRGSARINKEGRAVLRKVVDHHRRHGGTLRVVGHASKRTRELSSVSHELANFDISFKRAQAVANELIRRGAAVDKVKVVAMSDNVPAYREWMPSGEAGNRRAEVFIDF